MRNFAVKFAILINRQLKVCPQLTMAGGSSLAQRGEIAPVTVQELLDVPPIEMLRRYKQYLTQRDRGVLMFGFEDQAILDLLDAEFEVDVERNTLIFRKTSLDAASIRIASGLGQAGFTLEDGEAESLVGHLSNWLLDASRSLYREDLNELRIADIKAEYAACLRKYALNRMMARMDDSPADALYGLLASVKAMKGFLHGQTADAVFKMDAAQLLFGGDSGYCQAWMRKQFFRNLVAQCVESYIIRSAA